MLITYLQAVIARRGPRLKMVPAARIAGLTLACSLAMAASVLAPVFESAFASAPRAEAKGKNDKPAQRAARRQSQKSREAALEKARKRNIPNSKKSNAGAAAETAASASASAPIPERKLTTAEKKISVLAAPPETLRRIGRHIIVGYYAGFQLTPLIERGAIGGIFVTKRNAHRRNKASLAKELQGFREKALSAGQTSFWIATDQEGGSVSRLTPPLPRQKALPQLIGSLKTPEERKAAVETYAAKQATALADVGINVNFAPVADLNHNVRNRRDRFTRIRLRAISSDPTVVTNVARTYCETLIKARIFCTLKHFPGIGRVFSDTHVMSAVLKTPVEELEKTDWVPFRDIISTTPAFLMVGHHHVNAIDAERPASTSPAVIQGLLRDKWKFDGVVVTDDLAMGAIRKSKGGMAVAAIDALNAGADLVLLGNDGDDVYDVLYMLMLAEEQGKLAREKIDASAKRLATATEALAAVATAPAVQPAESTVPKTKTARQ